MWTHGESDPELIHAMDAYYRYTMSPNFEYNNSHNLTKQHTQITHGRELCVYKIFTKKFIIIYMSKQNRSVLSERFFYIEVEPPKNECVL